jgi:plastocyanin
VRIRFLWIGILASASLPVAVASAASQSVTASSNVFTPEGVTVLQGESVTWSNSGGFHNVHFNDESFVEPPNPTDTWPAIVSHTFGTPGTYKYRCDAHVDLGMTGTVTVLATGTTPPPPVAADKVAPGLKLGAQSRQKVVRRRAVSLAVEVDEASTVVARGAVAVPGGRKVRTKETSRKLAAGEKATLKLRFSSQAMRKLRRAFVKRKRLTARVTVIARDAAGNVRSAKRRISLRGRP